MATEDSAALIKQIGKGEIKCIDGEWHVKLDKDKSYTFQENPVKTE